MVEDRILTPLEKYGGMVARVFFGIYPDTEGRKPHINRCIEAAERRGISTISTEVLTDIITYYENDSAMKQEEIVPVTPFDPHMEEKKLRYIHLLDPEKGIERIKGLIKIVEDGRVLRLEDELGLDPLGGEIVVDIIKISTQVLLLEAAKLLPAPIRKAIEKRVEGTRGEIRNLTKEVAEDGQEYLLLVDPGMHDLSPNGKFKPVTSLINGLTFAALIEILKEAIKHHENWDKTSIESQIDALQHNATPFETKLAKRISEMMIPMALRYEERNSAT